MITEDSLHELLFDSSIRRLDQMLIIIASAMPEPITTTSVRDRAIKAGLRKAKTWNISDILSRSSGKAVNKADGWVLTPVGTAHLETLGISVDDPHVSATKSSLRQHLTSIQNEHIRDFVEESICSFESKRYRSAVVLSWVGATAILYEYVVKNEMASFNAEAKRRDTKWRTAKTSDDLARMKEHAFLDILEGISVLGKNVKQELQGCLKLRNGCGHPNTLKIADHSVAAHIEKLVLNVYAQY